MWNEEEGFMGNCISNSSGVLQCQFELESIQGLLEHANCSKCISYINNLTVNNASLINRRGRSKTVVQHGLI